MDPTFLKGIHRCLCHSLFISNPYLSLSQILQFIFETSFYDDKQRHSEVLQIFKRKMYCFKEAHFLVLRTDSCSVRRRNLCFILLNSRCFLKMLQNHVMDSNGSKRFKHLM